MSLYTANEFVIVTIQIALVQLDHLLQSLSSIMFSTTLPSTRILHLGYPSFKSSGELASHYYEMPSSPTESHGSATDLLQTSLRAGDYKYASMNEPNSWPQRLLRWTVISAIVLLILMIAAFFGITSLQASRSPEDRPVSCGNTFEEARDHGCTFDPLTLTWLRPECSLHGQKEFSESSGHDAWRYWEDKGGSLVEIGGYESLAYLAPGTRYLATYEQFLHHCMWILLRVHHALEYGERLDFKTISYEHSKDCLGLLLKEAKAGVGANLTRLSTRAEAPEIGYGVC